MSGGDEFGEYGPQEYEVAGEEDLEWLREFDLSVPGRGDPANKGYSGGFEDLVQQMNFTVEECTSEREGLGPGTFMDPVEMVSPYYVDAVMYVDGSDSGGRLGLAQAGSSVKVAWEGEYTELESFESSGQALTGVEPSEGGGEVLTEPDPGGFKGSEEMEKVLSVDGEAYRHRELLSEDAGFVAEFRNSEALEFLMEAYGHTAYHVERSENMGVDRV